MWTVKPAELASWVLVEKKGLKVALKNVPYGSGVTGFPAIQLTPNVPSGGKVLNENDPSPSGPPVVGISRKLNISWAFARPPSKIASTNRMDRMASPDC